MGSRITSGEREDSVARTLYPIARLTHSLGVCHNTSPRLQRGLFREEGILLSIALRKIVTQASSVQPWPKGRQVALCLQLSVDCTFLQHALSGVRGRGAVRRSGLIRKG